MRRYINGARYNTATARRLAGTTCLDQGEISGPTDQGYWAEDLYITPAGHYFLHGWSNAGGKYSPNGINPGEVIIPIEDRYLQSTLDGVRVYVVDRKTGELSIRMFYGCDLCSGLEEGDDGDAVDQG